MRDELGITEIAIARPFQAAGHLRGRVHRRRVAAPARGDARTDQRSRDRDRGRRDRRAHRARRAVGVRGRRAMDARALRIVVWSSIAMALTWGIGRLVHAHVGKPDGGVAVPLRSRHVPRDDPHRGARLRHAAGGDHDAPRAASKRTGTARARPRCGHRIHVERRARRAPGARLVLVDENPGMLAVATDLLPRRRTSSRSWSPTSPIPSPPVRSISSCRRSRSIISTARRSGRCSRRCTIASAPGGRFAMADVVLPDDPAEVVTPAHSRLRQARSRARSPRVVARGRISAPSTCGRRPTSACSCATSSSARQSMRRISAR